MLGMPEDSFRRLSLMRKTQRNFKAAKLEINHRRVNKRNAATLFLLMSHPQLEETE